MNSHARAPPFDLQLVIFCNGPGFVVDSSHAAWHLDIETGIFHQERFMTRPCTDICKLRAPRVDGFMSVKPVAQYGAIEHPSPRRAVPRRNIS